jgi:hypothetical protein
MKVFFNYRTVCKTTPLTESHEIFEPLEIYHQIAHTSNGTLEKVQCTRRPGSDKTRVTVPTGAEPDPH